MVCYCAALETIETRTRVLLLQHPHERDVAINTARIVRQALPNSALHVGMDFEDDPVVGAEISDPARPAILLFPGPDATDLRAQPPLGPVTLVVIDGTWSQASKILRHNPALRTLPRYALMPARPSEYRIRRQPAEHCVATIEAVAEALEVLEGDPTCAARLRAPFCTMVAAQLAFETRNASAPRRHRPRGPRPGRRSND